MASAAVAASAAEGHLASSDRLEHDLQALARGLEAALGADLVSLLLYGSKARSAAPDTRADVNLLLVVKDASPAVLRRAAAPLAAWTRSGQRPPLIHSEAEWRAAADVFPVEMDDIREAHRLLAGSDPTEGIVTQPADVRRELERETRGVLARLRAAWASVGEEGPSLEELLAGSVGTVLVLLRAAVRLSGARPEPTPAGVVEQAGRTCGSDAAAFAWPLAARTGAPPHRLAAFDDAATNYLVAVQQFSDWLDRSSGH